MGLLTQTELKQRILYDPDKGLFFRICRYSGWPVLIDVKPRSDGYIRFNVGGRAYYAHCLAWLYMTGEWPRFEIDHIDLDPTNLKWNNLRQATPSQNCGNRRVRADSSTGLKGVFIRPLCKVKKYQAKLGKKSLGYFSDPLSAHAAYCDAAEKHYGKFARTK